MPEKDGQLALDYILECLKDNERNLANILAFRDTAYSGKYKEADMNAIIDAWTNLILDGWIGPDPQQHSGDWLRGSLRITSYGKTQLGLIGDDYYPVFLDPVSTISGLKSTILNIDSIALKYFEESLWAAKKDLYLSAIVTLGCASERSILLLIEAMLDYYGDATLRTEFNKSDKIKPKFELFKKTIADKGLKRELLTLFGSDINKCENIKRLFIDFDNTLDMMFQIYRTNRNDAGHPSGIEFDRDITRAEAAMFRKYCKIIYGLILYMEAAKKLKPTS